MFITIFLLILELIAPPDFVEEQKRHSRVRSAWNDNIERIRETLRQSHMRENDLRVLFVAYKEENVLELYARPVSSFSYSLLGTFDVCARSGQAGPKRRRGDMQVPEGFYVIDRFNPASSYHLSLGVSYPNKSDRIRSAGTDPGGDIFIHGSCVTIGCLPMTDEKIREIYIYAVLARQAGQKDIPVYIFPFRMNERNLEKFNHMYRTRQEVVSFWKNLREGYDQFKVSGRELRFSVNENGDYVFSR